jgi:hypothetical protein
VAGLAKLNVLRARPLSIVINDDAVGTHAIAFNGDSDDVVAFHLSEGQLGDAIGAVRAALRDVHLEEYGGRLEGRIQLRNRYDSRNAKTRIEFRADLRRLAPLGRDLWEVLFAAKPERRRQLLQGVLRDPAVIQVARTGHSTFVFPWALVYDIPLEPGNPSAWAYCSVVDEWDPHDEPPEEASDRCPYEAGHRLNVLCPFGFWGVHHVIEQPPSMPSGRTLPVTVKVDAPPPHIVVGLSQTLDFRLTAAHMDRLEQCLQGYSFERAETRAKVQSGLSDPGLEFVYFYCHGARSDIAGAAPQPCLEVGNGERLTPSDIGAWFDALWPADHWRVTSPLVFINGCHTAEITPRTLVQFVDAFAGVFAAGVIGTEIAVHQQVAGEAAEEFWRRLQAGASVGEALRGMRVHLLRKNNLIGLAYTAYCSADLRLVGAA